MKVVLEKRLEQSLKAQIGLPVLSALMALVFCGVFFALTGKDPLLVYESMFSGALGNDYGLSETFVKMIPMALCALGIAVAFRMQMRCAHLVLPLRSACRFGISARKASFTWAPALQPGCRLIFPLIFPICLRQLCCPQCLFWARWQAACGALLRAGLKQNGWLTNLSAL